MYKAGIDIGSISVNLSVMNHGGEIVEDYYLRHKGRSLETARDALIQVLKKYEIDYIAATGTGAKIFADKIGAVFVNEIVALSKAFGHLYPDVRTAIDIGGEDSKLIIFDGDGAGRLRVKDFSMNALCAAGTGSFLDQQASRLRFTIEEFSEVALKAENPPRIAGRCTVFAKSDMIHLQQIATPDYEIVAGLCYALARNFKGNIAKGKDIQSPIAFIGGVAANAGMKKAIRDVFGLNGDSFLIPERFASMGAIGAIFAVLDDPGLRREYTGIAELNKYLSSKVSEESLEPLAISEKNLNISYEVRTITEKTRAYLGVDVGSISTNLVVLDEDKNVLAKRYLMTEGRPLEAVKRGLEEIGNEIGSRIEVIGVCTTGSGRYLTADFIGADIVRNEITAQAEAAINIDPSVDTIFEIGGQDSKYISVDNGVIVDFEMNKACAAGTGSFLEEQAERLGISIKEEFGNLALSSKKPAKMGERCTVFIESDVVHHQQKGATTDELVSGLSYSIVANYLNKVVHDRRIGEKIFFQGGTAFNKAVVAAFEKITGKPITVPPHHDVTGAIGSAILAMKERDWDQSRFRGFDLSKYPYEVDTFECKGCENLCEIRRVTMGKESPLYYGSRCEKYDVVRRKKSVDIEDLFKKREDLLYGIYKSPANGEPIGIPMALYTHELFPFWNAFLSELGFSVIPSDRTNKKTIRSGVENIIVETCFPVKLAHGHILNLIDRGVKRIFLPSVINLKSTSSTSPFAFACPYAQSLPYSAKGSIDFQGYGAIVDSPVIYFGDGKEETLKNLVSYGKSIRKAKKDVERAFRIASETQERFYRLCHEEGARFLASLKDDEKGMVIIGRPYNSTDTGANLNIHRKLIDLGVKPIPMDMLPIPGCNIIDEGLEGMYWGYGQKIMRTGQMIRHTDNLYGIYITNFGCGPDSFISHFFQRTMKGKPYLQLEIDEHSADAGAVTRLEAFLDSIKNARVEMTKKTGRSQTFPTEVKNRKVYLPYMSDHAITLAAAFRGCGVDAEPIDESDDETVYWGRKYTTGKECYPCILTTGDMIKTLKKPGFDPDRSAFFMPSSNGPCRLGQYNHLQRLVLDDLGYENVPIYSPNQDVKFYNELDVLGSKFSRLGWKSVVATDLMIKMLHDTRPYEKKKGESGKIYRKSLLKIRDSIAGGAKDLPQILKNCMNEFLEIEKISIDKPIVGIVGEIYIRSNRYGNSHLIEKIEELGGHVWLAPITEWIFYVNYIAKRNGRRRGATFSEFLKLFLTDYYQRKDEHELEKIFAKSLSYGKEPKISHILDKASPYIHESFNGEAILSVGKSIDFMKKNVSGIVNAMPFTCMPGTISSSIMKLLQSKYDVPIINIAYDGQGLTNIVTRIEAFMYQVKDNYQYQKKGERNQGKR